MSLILIGLAEPILTSLWFFPTAQRLLSWTSLSQFSLALSSVSSWDSSAVASPGARTLFISAPVVLISNPVLSISALSSSSCVSYTFTVIISCFFDWSAKVISIVAILSTASLVSASLITLIVASSGRFLKAFL